MGLVFGFGIMALMAALFVWSVFAVVQVWQGKKKESEKIMWTLLLLLLMPFGLIFWYRFGKSSRKR